VNRYDSKSLHLFVLAAATAFFLSGCAPDLGMLTRDPQDFCSRPNVLPALVEGLHKIQGYTDASLQDVSTVPVTGFDLDTTLGSPAPAFACHATIVRRDGGTTTGRIVVSEGFRKVTWMSDADYKKSAAVSAAQSERDGRALFEKRRADQDRLARCDPAIKARYDAAVSQLSRGSADYWQYSHQNETAQGFSGLRRCSASDHETARRRIAGLQSIGSRRGGQDG
jgi:hypothetical protein